jgi:hypothetical protein
VHAGAVGRFPPPQRLYLNPSKIVLVAVLVLGFPRYSASTPSKLTSKGLYVLSPGDSTPAYNEEVSSDCGILQLCTLKLSQQWVPNSSRSPRHLRRLKCFLATPEIRPRTKEDEEKGFVGRLKPLSWGRWPLRAKLYLLLSPVEGQLADFVA